MVKKNEENQILFHYYRDYWVLLLLDTFLWPSKKNIEKAFFFFFWLEDIHYLLSELLLTF